MKKGVQLYEGKAKKVFPTDNPDILIVDYKDDATAFNGEKKVSIVPLLKAYFLQADMRLIDFKIEFGRYHDTIILADEISPDTCRLWDVHTNEKLDKDRFRRDLGNVEEAYQEVIKRLGIS